MARKKTNIKTGYDAGISGDNYIDKNTMQKIQKAINGHSGIRKNAMGAVSFTAPTFYNPLYSESSLQLPRDRLQLNVYLRHYYQTEPFVAAAIDLYSDLPITGYTIECSDPVIKKFFEDMCKRIKILDVLHGIALEYYMIGDVFIMNELDHENKTWKRLVVLNPDQVTVRRDPLIDTPVINLIPDKNIKDIVFDRKPIEMYESLLNFAPEVIQAVNAGQNIPLNPEMTTHLRHKPTPYGIYGNPLLKRVLKTLMYKEMIRKAQFAIAERFVTPLKVFKLGTVEEVPPPDQVAAFQELLDISLNDPKGVLITNQRVQVEFIGIGGKTLALNGEYEFIENETLCGLGISKAFLGGEGGSFASASIGGNGFLQKLDNFREILKEFIEEKVFKPILELNGWYESDPDTDEEHLVHVEWKWDTLRLESEASIQQSHLALRQQNLLSAKTMLNTFHIDFETEAINIMNERDTIFDAMRIMSRQVGMNTETTLAKQLEYQQMSQLLLNNPNAGMQPAPENIPIGSTATPPGFEGATPTSGNNAGNANVPTPGQIGTMPRGMFTPVDSIGIRPPQNKTASLSEKNDLIDQIKKTLNHIEEKLSENE